MARFSTLEHGLCLLEVGLFHKTSTYLLINLSIDLTVGAVTLIIMLSHIR